MNTQHEIRPIPGISNEELERFAAVIAAKVLPLIDKGEEVFNREEAAAFIKYSVDRFDRISAKLGCVIIPGGDRRYLKSRLIEYIKSC